MLRTEHEHTYRTIKPVPPFNALHTACQIVDFPISFLILLAKLYPGQLHTATIGSRDLPLDMVQSWEIEDGGDKTNMECRKRMACLQLEHFTSDEVP